MKILICDDDKIFVEEVERKTKALLNERNLSAEFALFDDSEAVISQDESYDIAFVDIEMPKFNGIQVAEKLKKINPYIIIFIITSFDKYLDDAMDLNVFRYIQKPLDENRLRRSLLKALEQIDNHEISFFFKQDKLQKSVSSNDIVFIEITGRYTRVVTVGGEYISNNNLKFWKEKLIAKFFYQVHKSYIINMKHITDYKRDTVTLLGKYNVPIAYREQSNFRSFFLNYFGG